ncbi:hypothetical protein BD309DRAFT_619535 [Dichomitus squalens]|uniref:Uncharacterized protein n=1 Tax=Dichomitus squalens TaxID=114155 RepID=A0A4Q9P055_9APHY|nr:hypothetical protein BD309DRAFT_619535 [Dichomitus squalens]TBU65323.1 hypothetical protein BD310DRAFT_3015 [Dichomitus squalens]
MLGTVGRKDVGGRGLYKRHVASVKTQVKEPPKCASQMQTQNTRMTPPKTINATPPSRSSHRDPLPLAISPRSPLHVWHHPVSPSPSSPSQPSVTPSRSLVQFSQALLRCPVRAWPCARSYNTRTRTFVHTVFPQTCPPASLSCRTTCFFQQGIIPVRRKHSCCRRTAIPSIPPYLADRLRSLSLFVAANEALLAFPLPSYTNLRTPVRTCHGNTPCCSCFSLRRLLSNSIPSFFPRVSMQNLKPRVCTPTVSPTCLQITARPV